jgi:hypothetical protein
LYIVLNKDICARSFWAALLLLLLYNCLSVDDG